MENPPDPRNEGAVIEAIRHELHYTVHRELTPEAIALLRADGTLRQYMQNPNADTWRALLAAARRHTRASPGRRTGKVSTKLPTRILTDQEVGRAAARSRALARRAARRSAVANLRGRLFGGRCLSLEEAAKWLALPTVRFFSKEWFDKHGIPLVDHEAELADPRTGGPTTWGDDAVEHCVFQIRWDGGSCDVPLRMIYAESPGARKRLSVGFGSLYAQDHSVVDDIQQVAAQLATHYEWQEGEAFLFAVTGHPPRTPGVSWNLVMSHANDHRHVCIELRIEPWVSIGSVRRAYEHIQKRTRIKQSYTRGEWAFSAFEFVEELCDRWHPGPDEEDKESLSMVDFDWRRAANEWNERVPRHPIDASALKENYQRVLFTIVYPPFTGPRSVKSAEDEGKEDT